MPIVSLKTLKTAAVESVIVTVIVSALLESSDTNIDFIIAVAFAGVVYRVVTPVEVKSTFTFLYVLAIYPKNQLIASDCSFKLALRSASSTWLK